MTRTHMDSACRYNEASRVALECNFTLGVGFPKVTWQEPRFDDIDVEIFWILQLYET